MELRDRQVCGACAILGTYYDRRHLRFSSPLQPLARGGPDYKICGVSEIVLCPTGNFRRVDHGSRYRIYRVAYTLRAPPDVFVSMCNEQLSLIP